MISGRGTALKYFLRSGHGGMGSYASTDSNNSVVFFFIDHQWKADASGSGREIYSS
jgi:hypothetical protein